MKNKLFVPWFIVIIFVVPMLISWIFYYYHDYFHFKTTNYGQLITHPYQLDLNHEKKWQVVLVTPAAPILCDATCAHQLFFLQQMRKLLAKDADRVTVLQIAAEQTNKLAANKIYLIDPLHNVFMYYPDTMNVMNILTDLKKVLEVSQIG